MIPAPLELGRMTHRSCHPEKVSPFARKAGVERIRGLLDVVSEVPDQMPAACCRSRGARVYSARQTSRRLGTVEDLAEHVPDEMEALGVRPHVRHHVSAYPPEPCSNRSDLAATRPRSWRDLFAALHPAERSSIIFVAAPN